MSEITVLRPDVSPQPRVTARLAPREDLPRRPTIGLVANGKPLAKELLTVLAEEITKRLGREVDIVLLEKPTSAFPISDDEASQLAARCHLVIAGLGD
jgi:hypothetical protein